MEDFSCIVSWPELWFKQVRLLIMRLFDENEVTEAGLLVEGI
jgi:hypothetical protein